MILNDFAKKQADFEIGQKKFMSPLIIRTPEEIEADDKKVEVMIAKSNKKTLAGPTRIEGGIKPNLEQVINQQKQIDNEALKLKASIISKQLLELSKELQNSIALSLIKENLKERASTAINDARKKLTSFKTKFKR